MEAFCFGFNFSIQQKAAKITNRTLALVRAPRCRRYRYRYHIRKIQVPCVIVAPVTPVIKRIVVPNVFEIKTCNMFECLNE